MKKFFVFSLFFSLLFFFPDSNVVALGDVQDKEPSSVISSEGGSRINCVKYKKGVVCTPRDCTGGDEY